MDTIFISDFGVAIFCVQNINRGVIFFGKKYLRFIFFFAGTFLVDSENNRKSRKNFKLMVSFGWRRKVLRFLAIFFVVTTCWRHLCVIKKQQESR